MDTKTNLLEDYINSVDSSLSEHPKFIDSTKKQNTHLKIFLTFFMVIVSLFLFFLLFK